VTENTDGCAVRGVNLERVYHVDHREVRALRGANVVVEVGECVALMGRSGSGKTTLLNIIGGLDYPTNGQVYVFGRDIGKAREHERTVLRRHDIGFVFQSFALLPTMSAYENVELCLRMIDVPRRERRDRVMECLDLVKLTRWAKHRPQEMSGGQQQRVAIARALVNRPKLILADEPTGELDSITGRGIMALFQEIVRDQGVTIVMASHDPTIEEYVDYVYRMADGQIINER
jgi:ABC-type lipoprotein export system ATPase subunit